MTAEKRVKYKISSFNILWFCLYFKLIFYQNNHKRTPYYSNLKFIFIFLFTFYWFLTSMFMVVKTDFFFRFYMKTFSRLSFFLTVLLKLSRFIGAGRWRLGVYFQTAIRSGVTAWMNVETSQRTGLKADPPCKNVFKDDFFLSKMKFWNFFLVESK